MELLEQLRYLLSVEGIQRIIEWGGLLILIAIVFSETGLLVGFFLPGDSLLVCRGSWQPPPTSWTSGRFFSPCPWPPSSETQWVTPSAIERV